MTNAEKFEDVFGFPPADDGCIVSAPMCMIDFEDMSPETVGKTCEKCPYDNFWGMEYETPDRLPFE